MQRTISTFFREAVDAVGDDTWLLSGDDTFTYGEALALVEAGAARLRSEGVGIGDHVLVTARTTGPYLLTWLAIMEAGAVQVPVNPASTPAELAGLCRQVRPTVVVTDAELAATVRSVLAEVGGDPRLLDVDALFEGSADGQGPASVDERSPAVMIPTSGTTGRSKLVVQTHLAYVMAGEGFPYWMQLDAGDRLLTSLPLFHINAPAYTVLGSVGAHASVVLLPRFSASGFLDDVRRYGATEVNALGAMLEILMRQPERPDDATTTWRRCYTGPAPERERHLEIEERFGIELVCGYGLSESPYALIWRRGERPYGTMGSPRQHPTLGHVNDARVMADGAPIGVGGVGELELRNPAIMVGYHGMDDATAEVLVDGWLRTGDLVRVEPDDVYTFVSRQKDVIRRRGENLAPAEVEAALASHPAVAEAVVVGVPSELSDEDVKAWLLLAPGATLDVDDLHRHAGQQLARFKVPRYYEVVDELPLTPTGRVAKHQFPKDRRPDEIDMEGS
ncbi:MAG: AMP-binding protein [Acidimicrobiia bacterium]|nr:AMP-binding protein [Acidimicrobiia bacterium]